jgi:hypothetical protein
MLVIFCMSFVAVAVDQNTVTTVADTAAAVNVSGFGAMYQLTNSHLQRYVSL